MSKYMRIIVTVCIVSLLLLPSLFAQENPLVYVDANPDDALSIDSGVVKEYFEITQELHADLELYTNELITLNNGYLYREDKLMIDDLIAQILPVFKSFIIDAKHTVRTINRLLYLEYCHLEWDQSNPKALIVIDDYVDLAIALLEKDIVELQSISEKVPSMTDVPLLLDHYERTSTIVHMSLATLQRIDAFSSKKREVLGVDHPAVI